MGYQRKAYVLKWPSGHDLHGLEVTAKGLPMGQLFELAPLADQLQGDTDMKAKVEAGERLFTAFAGRLVSWNLEDDDGAPVPATLEGVCDQDFDFLLPLVMAWLDAVASVDIPLPSPSPDGGSSETEPPGVASIPVETLSPSPLSS